MLRCIAEVKEDLQIMGYELELGVSCVCHAHVLFTHVATHVYTHTPSCASCFHSTGETEFEC
jgi:hypothetical protein